MHFIKVFELELSNMEDCPVYELKHQLSFGSEIGNIIIADPSVSPRHASFILQQQVVSVIDHGSVAGTLINGKKIQSGKYIILEETDVVSVGDLEVRLKSRTVAAPGDELPELPVEEVEHLSDEGHTTDEVEVQEEITDEINIRDHLDEDHPSPPHKTVHPEIRLEDRSHLKKKKKKTKKIEIVSNVYSANALVRVLAVTCDLLLSYSILIIFLPFDDFRNFLEFVPSSIGAFLDVEWSAFWASIMEEHAFVGEMLADVYKFFSSTFDFLPLLITFVSLRVLSTFIFGVSFSELLLGVRALGNRIWARIGGVLRVLIGAVTWPFLIFDVPAVVSRRTFKEFVTFTHISTPSKFITILGVLLYLPLVLVFTFVAPLLQGFDPLEPIIVNDRVERRVKVNLPETGSAEVIGPLVTAQSRELNLELSYDPEDVTVIPNFKFYGVKNKLNLKSALIFYQNKSQRSLEFEVFKKFDLKQLLGIGMRGNFFLYVKYPALHKFVYSAAEANPNFKVVSDEKTHQAFANEFIQFTKMAFGLSGENAMDTLQEQTLLLKGLVDYKSSFLSLLEYKKFDQISFIKIGNVIFMRVSYNLHRPFDLIIPLTKGEGQIFKVTWDKSEEADLVASRFYKFNLEKANWFPELKSQTDEEMTALEIFDLFSTEDFKSKLMTSSMAQRVYAYYFEASSKILKKADPLELELWKKTLANVPKILETLPVTEVVEGSEDIREKLLQNFNDLIDALDNNNLEYFGITNTTTI
jgi:hypothetical protein